MSRPAGGPGRAVDRARATIAARPCLRPDGSQLRDVDGRPTLVIEERPTRSWTDGARVRRGHGDDEARRRRRHGDGVLAAGRPLRRRGGRARSTVLHGLPSWHFDLLAIALVAFLAAVALAYRFYGRGLPERGPDDADGPADHRRWSPSTASTPSATATWWSRCATSCRRLGQPDSATTASTASSPGPASPPSAPRPSTYRVARPEGHRRRRQRRRLQRRLVERPAQAHPVR